MDESFEVDGLESVGIEMEMIGNSDVNEDVSNKLDFKLYGDLSFEMMIELFNNIYTILMLCDVIFRLIHTVSLINKYWNSSSSFAPNLDVRLHKQNIKNSAATMYQTIAHYLTHPATLSTISLLFTSILFSIALTLYTPLFKDFYSGCVLNSQVGTVFTTNWNIAAHVQITWEGSLDMRKVQTEVTGKKTQHCMMETLSSMGDYNTIRYNLELLNQTNQEMLQAYSGLQECLSNEVSVNK